MINHFNILYLFFNVFREIFKSIKLVWIKAQKVALSLFIFTEFTCHAVRRLYIAAIFFIISLSIVFEPFKSIRVTWIVFRPYVIRRLLSEVHILLSAMPVLATFPRSIDAAFFRRPVRQKADLADQKEFCLLV